MKKKVNDSGCEKRNFLKDTINSRDALYPETLICLVFQKLTQSILII